jgi:uncharacterized membrane protein
MVAFVLGVIGLLAGLWVFTVDDELAGAALGAALGVAFGLLLRLAQQHKSLETELRQLQAQLRGRPTPAAEAVAAPAAEPAPVAAPPAPVAPVAAAPPAMPAPPLPPRLPRQPPPPPPPGALEELILRGVRASRDWLLGGNTVARVGLLLLFLGLAFLLQLAAQRMVFPVELRYAGVALVSLALLGLGWRLRERRRTYGLLLQGGAVAVLYLTIFAAMRVHPLLPPTLGFLLLVVVVVFSAILAVAQDSLALAAAGAAGGFAAPILTATGGEHHVALLTYFALLDAGILAIAWFKAWRPLNLIGFAATLVLGSAWGAGAYAPDMFATTEPFLVLFFLMYVAIALLFARRVLADAKTEPPAKDRLAVVTWAAQQSNYIDGILLFGTPISAFGLQYALVKPIEYGAAFSALGLGIFYMLLATVLFRRTEWRYLALVEVYVALGAIFATLAVPLGLDARWTSAAWAVEGAGIYWIAVRQDRALGRAFAVAVQMGAALSYLASLERSIDEALLAGARLGALLLGAAFLFSYWRLRSLAAERRRATDKPMPVALAVAGLGFLYLLAPLWLLVEAGHVTTLAELQRSRESLAALPDRTAIAWAVAGIVTLFLGLRLRDRTWMVAALAIQVLGGLLFLWALPSPGDDVTGAVLGAGWHGLFVAALVGGVALASVALVARDDAAALDPVVRHGVWLLLLFGLAFVNLAVIFVLPWRLASAVWAASGMLILFLGLRLQQRLSFAFGLVLQVVGGGAFLLGAYPALAALSPAGLTPLAHSGFWTPAAIALAAFLGAWLLFRGAEGEAKTVAAPLDAGLLSAALLAWATAWWGFAWLGEAFRFLPAVARPHAMVLVTAVTVLAWLAAAAFWQWRMLAAFCVLAMPAALLALLLAVGPYYHPASHLGALAWPALLAAHLLVLRRLPQLLPEKWPRALHVVGCWLFLTVLALELRFALIALSDHYNAWRWLGWAAVPALYLLAMVPKRILAFWPLSAYAREYRAVAALPVAVLLLAWLWLSNIWSDGSAAPLPYVPLINPLELGQLLVLLALLFWLRACFPMLAWAAPLPAPLPFWLIGASALFLLTCAVLRTAHQWLGIPYAIDALMASMLVQASLSILWGVAALALMVVGHLRGVRVLWIVGAALIAAVVVKLFLVELFNTQGLPRIVSFIGVGVLLLIIGYFAPLPPKHPDKMEAMRG